MGPTTATTTPTPHLASARPSRGRPRRVALPREPLPAACCPYGWKLETIVIPVSDVDGAKAFYVERAGFRVDVDHRAGEDFRVEQRPRPAPGSAQGLHLIVRHLHAALSVLASRGATVDGPFHLGATGQTPGHHPERVD